MERDPKMARRMGWLRNFVARPWWIATVSVSGLLVAIALVGLVGLVFNRRVQSVTERALEYDIELEDRGDDFRVAVLDMRHYHRNIVFSGSSRRGLADWEAAYLLLVQRIDELAPFGVAIAPVVTPDRLREMAERYYAGFRPAIDVYDSDTQTFTRASDDGLIALGELGQMAEEIDRLGERLAAVSLQSVEQANSSARLVLLAVLGGLGLVGAGLAYTTLRMVREQQEISAKLADALRAKTDFIADASHELRTPLTVLRGNAEVALELERTCVHTELLEEIVGELERMTRLIEDLLFLARSDAGSLPLELHAVDIQSLFVTLAERAEVLARKGGAAFRSTLLVGGNVRVDRVRIEQAVLILVDTAAKYSPPGETITLTAAAEAGQLIVEVKDRGPGIPAAERPFIFERFYRVDKARARKQGGAGLGLAIAKALIDVQGGRIQAQSSVGGGTSMKILLPLSATGKLPAQPVEARMSGDAR